MGISDVSSDVGSSDLGLLAPDPQLLAGGVGEDVGRRELRAGAGGGRHADRRDAARRQRVSRQGVVQGGRLGRCYGGGRSEEHTSELQSLMRISYAVFCLKTKKNITNPDIQQLRQATVHNDKHV